MENSKNKKHIPLWLKLTTLAWTALALFILFNSMKTENYTTVDYFFQQLKFSEAHNWGDVFAGFFAPLALLWVGFGVYVQRLEFNSLVESTSDQKKEMEKQSDLDMANWYSKYIENLRSLLTVQNVFLPNICDAYMHPSSAANYVTLLDDIENVLKINDQIEKYFFNDSTQETKRIINMIQTDYEVLHKKHIEKIKLLYLKFMISRMAQQRYTALIPIDIPASNFVSEDFKNIVNQLFDSTRSSLPEDIVINVFNEIINTRNIIQHVKVK